MTLAIASGLVLEVLVCIGIILYADANYGIESLFNPKEFHEYYKVNWFGAFFITLLINIICFGISILYWIKFICTVGRK